MRCVRPYWIALLVALLTVVLAPFGAHAYVRTPTKSTGMPLRWLVGGIALRPDRRGSQDLPLATIEETLATAADNWNSKMAACTSVRLIGLPATKIEDIGRDRSPIIIFRDREWQRIGAEEPNDASAIAITTVYYLPTPGTFDGTITDADIELNGVYFTFTTDVANAIPRDGTIIADLENTLTHELGHVLGLAHTCWDGVHVRLDDHEGNPQPPCEQVSPEVAATTMFAYAPSSDTDKRSVEPDDVQGVCDSYPTTLLPPRSLTISGGCQAAVGARASDLAAELDALRRGSDDRDALIAKLSALVSSAPDSDARDDAALWLADLRRYGGASAEAARAYEEVLARVFARHSPNAAALARRAHTGLGDLAAQAGDHSRARDLYRRARAAETGPVAEALAAKQQLAARSLTMSRAELVAAFTLTLPLAFFLWTLRKRSAPLGGVPTGVLYAAPIFALLSLSTLSRSTELAGALFAIGVGALLLLTLAVWSYRIHARAAALAYAALVSAANLSLIFLVLRRAGLWD